MSAEIKLEEVVKHKTAGDCWIILGERGAKKVYNVTAFINEHPGGADAILGVAGKDAHRAFLDAGHSSSARQMAEKYLVGPLEGGGADGKSEKCIIS